MKQFKGRYYTIFLNGEISEMLDKRAKQDKEFKPASFLKKIVEKKLVKEWSSLEQVEKESVEDNKLIVALLWYFIKENLGEEKSKAILELSIKMQEKNIQIFKDKLENSNDE